MSTVLISAHNRATPQAGATLSGGSWYATMGLDRLTDASPGERARSTSADPLNTQVSVELADQGALGADPAIRVLAVIGHTLSLAATIRWRLWSEPAQAGTLLHDTGALAVWGGVYDPSPLRPDGRPLAEDLAHLPTQHIVVLPAEIAPRSALVEIVDTANPDGCVELGQLWLGPAWQPSGHMQEDYAPGQEDSAQTQRSLGGRAWSGSGHTMRTAEFSLRLPAAEAKQGGWELQRLLGTTAAALVIPEPDDPGDLLRFAMLARASQLSPLTYTNTRWRELAWRFEELL